MASVIIGPLGGGRKSGKAFISIPAPKGNPPVNTVLPNISGVVDVGNTLQCDTGTWTSAKTVYYDYVWQRDSQDIQGSYGFPYYTLKNADVGHNICCVVIASNADGVVVARSETVSLPSSHNLSLPVITGTPTSGQTLTCSTGTWDNSPTSYTYQWKINGIVVGTSSTYTLVDGDVGFLVSCTITANGAGVGIATSLSVGPVASSGSGPASPDLTLGFPSGANPPSIPITYLSANNQVGDVLTLQWSQDVTFVTGVSSGTHALVNGDTSGSSISFGIPTLSLSAPWYFRIKNNTLGQWSNIVAWNDAIAPVFTSPNTFTQFEGNTLSLNITTNKTLSSLVISGGADQLQYTLSGNTLEWFGNKVQSFTTPLDSDGNNTYIVQVTATDLAGNTTTQTITGTVQSAVNPTPFTFTQQGPPSTPSTQYASNTITIAGLGTTNVTSSVSGGNYSLNGGTTWNPPGSFTVSNGSTIKLQGTSSASSTGTTTVSCTVGIYTTTWLIQNSSAVLDSTTKSANATLSNGNLSNQGNRFYGQNAGARATAVARASKVRVEVKLAAVGTGTWSVTSPMTMGFDNNTNVFSSGGLEPGHDGARAGLSVRVYPTGWEVWSNAVKIANGSATFAVGDYIGLEADSVNQTCKVTHIVSGVETTLATCSSLSTFGSAWWAWTGNFVDTTNTINMTGPWQGTISSGYVPYSL